MDQKEAICALFAMFTDAVKVAGSLGAPGGVLYSAVMEKLTLSQFEAIMGALVAAGHLRKSGHLYFYVERSA
jgi:hypothetical protein